MFNIGAGELIVILVIALIVLGPDKLPDAVRRAGRLYGELRRMSSGFQAELRDAIDEPMREIRSTTDLVKSTFSGGMATDDTAGPRHEAGTPATTADTEGAGEADHRVQGDRPEPLPSPSGAAAVTDLPAPSGAVPLPPPLPSAEAEGSLPTPSPGR